MCGPYGYLWCIAMVLVPLFSQGRAETAPAEGQSPRKTPSVDLVRRVEPGVVAVVRQGQAGKPFIGSGSIIHEAGFILTSDYVVQGQPGYVLVKGLAPLPYRVVGRLPDKDLALIKINASQVLQGIPLGRSHDLTAGEPILVGGNPGARGIVFSSGIVSSPALLLDVPNALTSSGFSAEACDRYIQFDAATSLGLSGGPLLNAEGWQIGVVTGRRLTEDGINLAVPADRVRACFRALAAPEERGDIWAGLEVDAMAPNAVITGVEPNGPGARAGLQAGDRIVSLYGRPVRDGLDWIMGLVGRKAGEALVVTFSRENRQQQVTLTLQSYPLFEPVPNDGLSEGLRYGAFHGAYTALPDFTQLEPVNIGIAPGPRATALEGVREADYALFFEGYVEIPKTGVYRMVLGSDGGSRLFLDGHLTVDNGGPHPFQEASGVCRLAAGLHPLQIVYFETTGDPELQFRIEPDDPSGAQAPIPLRFYCD